MTTDLYSDRITGPFTRPSICGGNTGSGSGGSDGEGNGTDESCVEFAPLESGGYALRDSKNPDAGVLFFNTAELDAFAEDYMNRRAA